MISKMDQYKQNEIEKALEEHDLKVLCNGYDDLPTIIQDVRRIIVIGDIHGDFKLAIACLKLVKLIDDNYDYF